MLRLREGGVEVVAAVRLEVAAERMLMLRWVHQLSHSGEEILRDAEERVDGSCCWVEGCGPSWIGDGSRPEAFGAETMVDRFPPCWQSMVAEGA